MKMLYTFKCSSSAECVLCTVLKDVLQHTKLALHSRTTYKINLDSLSVNQFETTTYQTKTLKLCGYQLLQEVVQETSGAFCIGFYDPSRSLVQKHSLYPVYFIIGEICSLDFIIYYILQCFYSCMLIRQAVYNKSSKCRKMDRFL